MSSILNKQEPLPRAYLNASSSTWNNSGQDDDGRAYKSKSQDDSSYKYFLDAAGRPLLVQRFTNNTYADGGGQSSSSASVDYFKYYYSDSAISIAQFNEAGAGDGRSIALRSVRTIKLALSPDLLITEELGFRFYDPSPNLLDYAFASRVVATDSGLRFSQYNTPDDYDYNGLKINYLPQKSSFDIGVDAKTNQLKYVSEGSDGDYEVGSGTFGLKDRVFSVAVTGKGDPKRRSSVDGSYKLSSSMEAKFVPFAGTTQTLMQWLQNDVLINNSPVNPGSAFESFIINSILKQRPFAFRGISSNNAETRSDGSNYKSSDNFDVDYLTGLYRSGSYQSSGKSRNLKAKTLYDSSSSNVFTNQYDSRPAALLSAAEVSALDSRLAALLDQGKVTAAQYSFGDWAGGRSFLFASI